MCYTDRQFENRIAKLADIEAKIKALETEKEVLKNDIIINMDGECVETGKVKILYQTIHTARFDSKQLKAENPALYEHYVRISESNRFTYKVK